MKPELFLGMKGISGSQYLGQGSDTLLSVLKDFDNLQNKDLKEQLTQLATMIHKSGYLNSAEITKEELTQFNRICGSYFPNGKYCGGP